MSSYDPRVVDNFLQHLEGQVKAFDLLLEIQAGLAKKGVPMGITRNCLRNGQSEARSAVRAFKAAQDAGTARLDAEIERDLS